MKIILLLALFPLCVFSQTNADNHPAGTKKLIWTEEFNYSGLPDPKKWRYEEGLVMRFSLLTKKLIMLGSIHWNDIWQPK